MIAKQIVEKYKLTPCPFCNGEVKIVVCDDEGNDHNDDYENDPWSGLGYKLRHTGEDVPNGVECPIATHDGEDLGKLIYDTREEAAQIWNKEFRRGTWISCKNNSGYKCSECGTRIKNSAFFNGNHMWCHKCGAKMDNQKRIL